jgi:DNA-binding transcriptional LysR family regulator
MFDWQDLHFFAVLARTGSLSAAARELGVDHATVGRRIAALERSLGIRLIDRLPRSSPLTAQGAAMSGRVAELEEMVHAIRRHARGVAASPPTTVRVSAPPTVAARLIAPDVAAFHRAHPNITLVLLGSKDIVALNRGEADIAVRMVRPEEKRLLIRKIGVMRFGLYAAPSYAGLPPEKWVFIGYDTARENLTQQTWLRSVAAGRPIVFQASDVFGQQEAARAGLGAVALPRYVGDPDPALIRLPAQPRPPNRDLWLITYPDLGRSPAIRAVMALLAESVRRACPLREKAR